MPRTLTGQITNTPVISLRKEGGYFEGVLQDGPREVKMKRGTGHVYEFKLLDLDGLDTQKKNEKGKYVNVDIGEGDTVSVFAPTVLHKALLKTSIGKTVKVVYLGLEASKKGGSDYHNFEVTEMD